MNAELTRRQMLKGLSLGAGATLLTPILEQLSAHAAGDVSRANRPRVVFVVQSNGMFADHLRPVGVEGPKWGPDNEVTREIGLADKTLHAALEPLAPFKNRLALVQHLSGRIGLSDHSANLGALGCQPAKKPPMGPTIDHLVAAAIPGLIPHVALGLSGSNSTMNYQLSASGVGQACPIVCSPELAFKSLFGSVAAEGGAQEFNHRTNLLEFMADDVKRTRDALAGEERAKFDSYLSAFETLHQRQKQIAQLREALRANTPNLGEKLTTSVSSLILEAQFENAAAALIAGLTNVVLLTSGGGGQNFGSFPEFGIPGLHHIGHGGGYEGKTSLQCFLELRRFHTNLIASLAAKLDAVKVGKGSLLDDTLIVYLSDSGEGHHPRLYEWPVVLLGNLGGRLKTNGRYLELPAYGKKSHRTMANLYCTILHALGKPTDKFGVPDPGLRDIDQTGPVAELLA